MRKLAVSVTIALLSLNLQAARTVDKSIGWPGSTLAGNVCFGGDQGFGPFDYTDPETNRAGKYGRSPPRPLVENTHFTPEVEQLISGNRSLTPAGDLDYTLRAFPNHHRALWSMSRYYLRQLKAVGQEEMLTAERAQRGITPAECYFHRATKFAPEDYMVPAIFGIYLHRRGELEAALASYKQAERKLPKHAELSYNMGLLYFDMGDIQKATEYAARAKAMGYPLRGLERKIARSTEGNSSDTQANQRSN